MRTSFKLILLFLAAATILTVRDFLLMRDALSGSRLAPCERAFIKQIRYACMSMVGIRTNNESVCQKIKAVNERLRCQGIVGNDSSTCARITHEDTRDFCYYNVAARTTDKNLCEKIQNQGHKIDCERKLSKKRIL